MAFALMLGATLLGGCATYHARPLPTGPDLQPLSALTVPAGTLHLPGLRPATIDPTRGLTETNLITLAVLDNPELKAARLRAGIAHAQLLEAGLLPDPQLAAGLSKSTLRTGYSAALSADIQALITRGAAKAAARAHVRQINLEILWQEWQVAERARELYIGAEALRGLRQTLDKRRQLLGKLYREEQRQLTQHQLAAGEVTADFAAWAAAESAWHTVELQQNDTQHALDALLGLEPGAPLPLRGASKFRPVGGAQFRTALALLPQRRADLLALRAGYDSQQQRLRKAILAQFPAIGVGVEKARSAEEGIGTVGIDVAVTLPLFNRNRGQIAIERATRAYLRQVYLARLDRAVNQADRLFRATEIMARQLRTSETRLRRLERIATAARANLQRDTLGLADYTRITDDALTARIAVIRQRAALRQAQAALATLLALPF